MAAPTITSARAPETEGSHTSLNEPSMEDILASIRRIIAEDQSNSLGRNGLNGLTRRPQPSALAPAAAEPVTTLLEETHAVETPVESEADADPHADPLRHAYEPVADEPQAATEAHAAPESAVDSHHARSPEPEAMQEPNFYEEEEPLPEPSFARTEDDAEPLISPTTGASITSSFQTLAESVMLQDPDLIERVMRESMRPLLKAWLDDHLPSIVERLVRAEIERVARGGRSRNT